jgi:RNA polymerase sigma-70 factor (ECF subfamily)
VVATSGDSDEAALKASLTEPARFTSIFECRAEDIYRYLSFRVGPAIAEDLTAETFARAFAGRNSYEPDRGSVQAWLYGIATNLVRHHRRDERRQMAGLSSIDAQSTRSPDSGAQLAERLRLRSALASLQPGWRNVVLLIGLGELTYEEAAAVLHIPIGTVRSRYARARAQLVVALTERPETDLERGAIS